MIRVEGETEKPVVVGVSTDRVDARDKVLGRAVFIGDITVSNMLHGKVLRSRHAHAHVLGIDVSRAEQLPGVKAVVTGADVPFVHGESLLDEPFMATDRVRFIGEAVAGVIAVDEATAEEAVGLIDVTYEELPAIFDPLAAMAPGSPLVHEDVATYRRASSAINPIPHTNVCNHMHLSKGDVARGLAESDFVFEDTYATPMEQHCSIEPHGAICLIDDDANVTLWANNDSPHRARKEISVALGIPLNKVRVICAPFIGGNFGGKGGLKAEACAIAMAWKVRNWLIKVMYSRDEEFTCALVRHPSVIKLKTGVKRDGTILAREARVYFATGAYAEKGPTVAILGGKSAAGPYRIPNVSIDSYCVYTNQQVAGSMRGYGAPQVCWAYESQMDTIAAKLGIDPLELRQRQAIRKGDVHATGQAIPTDGLLACLDQVAEAMEWGTKPLARDTGRGVACMERGIKTPFGSAAFVKVNEDGSADVLSSTTEVGQGSATVVCQIAAEELGLPLHQVRKASPDTAFTPYDASTTSSRSTFHMGNAVKMAAADAKAQILQMASKLLHAEPGDMEMVDGNVRVVKRPWESASIARVLGSQYGSGGTVLGRGYYFPPMPEGADGYFSLDTAFFVMGAQGAEVRVDRETGQVEILKLYAAHDAGKAIHPANCEGQILGGVAMGLGFAAMEDIVNKGGMALNPSFLGYKVPSALDVPEIVPMVVEHADVGGPYGAKGMGETTNVPTPAAISNAIFDAVGVRIYDLPITPDKVLAALRQKARGE